MNAFIKYFDNNNNKYMKSLAHDEELLEKFKEIRDKDKDLFKKEFDSEPEYL